MEKIEIDLKKEVKRFSCLLCWLYCIVVHVLLGTWFMMLAFLSLFC